MVSILRCYCVTNECIGVFCMLCMVVVLYRQKKTHRERARKNQPNCVNMYIYIYIDSHQCDSYTCIIGYVSFKSNKPQK